MEHVSTATYEPHLLPIFDGKFDVQCLFDDEEEEDGDRPEVPPRPSPDGSTYSIQFINEVTEDSVAPSGLVAGSNDRYYQNVSDAYAIKKRFVRKDENHSNAEVEGNFNESTCTTKATEESTCSSASEAGLNIYQNFPATVPFVPVEFVPEEQNDSDIDEDNEFQETHARQTTKDPTKPSELEDDLNIYQNFPAAVLFVPDEFVPEDQNDSDIDKKDKFQDIHASETAKDSTGPSELKDELHEQHHQYVSATFQSVPDTLILEEFELDERLPQNVPFTILAEEKYISATCELPAETIGGETSSVLETSF